MSRKYKFHDNHKLYFIPVPITIGMHWMGVFVREVREEYNHVIIGSWKNCQEKELWKFMDGVMKNDIELPASIKVNKYDREYPNPEKGTLIIELLNTAMFTQRLEYIHYNLPAGKAGPALAGLCELSEDHHYSYAGFYPGGSSSFNMLRGN